MNSRSPPPMKKAFSEERRYNLERISRLKLPEKDLASRTIDVSALDTGTAIIYQPSLLYAVSKRLLDIARSLLDIVALMPLFLVIALCIKLNDSGRILSRREMIGLRGRSFLQLKFRTMIPNADTYFEWQAELMREFQQNMKLHHDPRVVRVGRFLRKTYLDVLPQLFNVLVGHMSLVAPRAIHQWKPALYGEYGQKRHIVKPDRTGLWQISPDRHRCLEERIPLDAQYIDTCSFTVDLLILFKTFKVFITCTGV
jgi:lipopolysaccharide/colanic/teichoic acid biosynthesis glycosyltransferase